MIKEIKYTFEMSDTNPYINLLNLKEFPSECLIDLELNQLSGEYVKEIVEELKEVKEGSKEKCIFGFETTMIWCYKKGKGYYGEKYLESEITITYNYADDYITTELKIEQILKMMIEWRDYIDNWEKETGKVYEGI